MQNLRLTKQLAILILGMVVVPLLAGLFVYLVLDSSVCFSRLLTNAFPKLRMYIVGVSYPSSAIMVFIRNYLCDFFWAFSLESSVFLLLHSQNSFAHSALLSGVLSFGIEFAQMTNRVVGTFDIWDLVVETIAIILAGLILFFYQRRNAT